MNIPLLSLLLSQIDRLICATLVMVALVSFFPVLGASDGPSRLDVVIIIDVSLVSPLHGAALSREKIVEGARNWRLHLFMQSYTFILLPLTGAAILLTCKPFIPTELLLGVFYLCALPFTVSSSVAMTVMAKGNVPVAIFNAAISGLIGMIVTPLLVSSVIQIPGADLPVGKALLGMAEQLLLPLALGQSLRPVFGGFTNRHRATISKVDRMVILLIVFDSSAGSTYAGVWPKYPWETIVVAAVMSSVLLFVTLGMTTWLSQRAGLNLTDEITAVFCGLEKSLMNGVPMGKILFAGNSTFGLTVLPLVTCHQSQPTVCLTFARRCVDRVAYIENNLTTPASRMA